MDQDQGLGLGGRGQGGRLRRQLVPQVAATHPPADYRRTDGLSGWAVFQLVPDPKAAASNQGKARCFDSPPLLLLPLLSFPFLSSPLKKSAFFFSDC